MWFIYSDDFPLWSIVTFHIRYLQFPLVKKCLFLYCINVLSHVTCTIHVAYFVTDSTK